MSIKLVELARYPTTQEASLVRGLLKEKGIRAVLNGEATNSLWNIGLGSTGVRVIVKDNDVERAIDILRVDHSIDESYELGSSSK